MIRGVFGIDPVDYLYNFLFGGFILCLVGCGAPTVKRGVKNFEAIGVLVLLVLLLSWCGYRSFPRYAYIYQVIIESSEDLSDLELYLPMGAISQKPYMEILDHPYQTPEGSYKGGLLEDYSLEMIDTKYGEMLKLDIPGLQEKFKPGEETAKLGPKPPTPAEITPERYPYSGSIIFDMSHAPHEKLQFLPKLDAEEVKIVRSERFMGPIRVEAGEVVEEFKVPIKVGSDKEAEVKIWLDHHSGRGSAINFYASKGEGYSESVDLQTTTSAEWILADGEAARGVGVSGVE